MLQINTPDDLRAFLRLCLDPGPGRDKRTVEHLAEIMPPFLVDQLAEFAPELGVLRDRVNMAEAAAKAARAEYTKGLRSWISQETTGVAEAPETGLCPQNLIGDKAVPGEHYYPPDDPDACVFCSSGRTYVFNARSVNRSAKHAHDGQGRTLCPSGPKPTAPMPAEEAARLPLCGGCRRALRADSSTAGA